MFSWSGPWFGRQSQENMLIDDSDNVYVKKIRWWKGNLPLIAWGEVVVVDDDDDGDDCQHQWRWRWQRWQWTKRRKRLIGCLREEEAGVEESHCCLQPTLCTTMTRRLSTTATIIMMRRRMLEDDIDNYFSSGCPLWWGGKPCDLSEKEKFSAVDAKRSFHRSQEPRRQLRRGHHSKPRGHCADPWTGQFRFLDVKRENLHGLLLRGRGLPGVQHQPELWLDREGPTDQFLPASLSVSAPGGLGETSGGAGDWGQRGLVRGAGL